LEQLGIRRVVLLPTEHEPTQAAAAERLRTALTSEIRATGLFEVIAPPIEEFGCWDNSNLAYGWVSAEVLGELSLRYSADGVIFSSLGDYHPYSPPRIAATVHLVGIREAATLVSVDGTWDARNESVSRTALQYSNVLAPSERMGRADIVLQTPVYYEKFVANQVAYAFATQWPQFEPEIISFAPAVADGHVTDVSRR